MKTLQTARLCLREARAEDFDFIAALMNESGYIAAVGDLGVRSASDAEQYVATAEIYNYREGLGFNVVDECRSATPIGICGLVRRQGSACAELGYGFLELSAGRGFATEAAGAVVSHALGGLRLAELVAVTSPDNEASQRVLDKIGMHFSRLNEDGDCVFRISGEQLSRAQC